MGSRESGRWRKNVPSSLSCQALLSPTLLWRELLFRDDEDMVVCMVVGRLTICGMWCWLRLWARREQRESQKIGEVTKMYQGGRNNTMLENQEREWWMKDYR